MGYSVGRWEGDTLVVESNVYNDWGGDKFADARTTAVEVTAEILAKYVGRYSGIWLDGDGMATQLAEVQVSGAWIFKRVQ